MDTTNHTDACPWKIKKITKTKSWYTFLGIKNCPSCGAVVEVTNA